MPSYRISTISNLLGVSDDSIRRWIDERLIEVDHSREEGRSSGPLRVDGASVVRFLEEKPDIHQLTSATETQSIRNHLPGLVISVESDKVMSKVEMQCGAYRLVSLISTQAVNQLGLEVGSVAVAQIKATNVSVQIPEGEQL